MASDSFKVQSNSIKVASHSDMFYPFQSHLHALASIVDGIRLRKGLILLSGKSGRGNSAVLQQTAKHIDPSTNVVFAQTKNHFNILLAFFCRSLNLPFPAGDQEIKGKNELSQFTGSIKKVTVNQLLSFFDHSSANESASESEQVESLKKYLNKEFRRDRNVVLFLDNIDGLDLESLDHLVALTNDSNRQRLLQIVIACSPQLEQSLIKRYGTAVGLQCHLANLKESDIGAYIHSLIDSAGFDRPIHFTGEAISKIAFYSKSKPKRVNKICRSALLNARLSEQSIITGKMIEKIALNVSQKVFLPNEANLVARKFVKQSKSIADLKGNDDYLLESVSAQSELIKNSDFSTILDNWFPEKFRQPTNLPVNLRYAMIFGVLLSSNWFLYRSELLQNLKIPQIFLTPIPLELSDISLAEGFTEFRSDIQELREYYSYVPQFIQSMIEFDQPKTNQLDGTDHFVAVENNTSEMVNDLSVSPMIMHQANEQINIANTVASDQPNISTKIEEPFNNLLSQHKPLLNAQNADRTTEELNNLEFLPNTFLSEEKIVEPEMIIAKFEDKSLHRHKRKDQVSDTEDISVPTAPTQSYGKLSGQITAEVRGFPNSSVDQRQSHDFNASVAIQPKYYLEWDKGNQSILFSPFFRYDQHDDERTHFDIRELSYIKSAEDWELRVGISKVFWGVTEAVHLVDIINQTDLVENIDTEDKLGQPMINLALIQDWGTLDLFVLPGFRERTFPGKEGRLRSYPHVDTDNAEFESAAENAHIDLAAHWTHSVGDWDVGVGHFYGTSREPRLKVKLDKGGEPVLIPHYDIINQTSLELQATKGDWLWKLEGIHQFGKKDNFFALTGGFEYTFNGVLDSDIDVGLVGEYIYDGRDNDEAPPTAFDDDIAVGLRFALNDAQSTEALFTTMIDRKTQATFFNLEASRRIGDNWKLELEGRFFENIPKNSPLYGFRNDDYFQLSLSRHF